VRVCPKDVGSSILAMLELMDYDLTFKVVAERGRGTAYPLLEYSTWASTSRLDHPGLFEGKGCRQGKQAWNPNTALVHSTLETSTGSLWRVLVFRGSICVQRVWYTTVAGFRTVY
jgi:hypothetical protein